MPRPSPRCCWATTDRRAPVGGNDLMYRSYLFAPRPDGMRCFSSGCGRRRRSLTLACRRPRQALTQRDGWARRGRGRRAGPPGRFMRIAPGRPGRHLPGARLAGRTWMYARQREPGSHAHPAPIAPDVPAPGERLRPPRGGHTRLRHTPTVSPRSCQPGRQVLRAPCTRSPAPRPMTGRHVAHSRPDHSRGGRNVETDPAAYPRDGRAGPEPGHPGLAQASFRSRLSRPGSTYNLAHSRLSRAY